MNNLMREMDKMLEEIPLEAPWDSPHAELWDNMTVQQFFDTVCWTRHTKEFGRAFVNLVVTMEPSEISLLWFLWYVKSCGGCQRIWEVEGGGQERKFKGGSMQISERIAERLGDRMKMGKPVYQITDRDDVVTVKTLDGTIFKARYVILAMAPTLISKIHFDPALPARRNQFIQRLPMGSCIKNNVFYKKAFWREDGHNGLSNAADGMTVVGDSVDDCKPDGSLPALTGFIMADRARDLSLMTREVRYKLTSESFANIFGNSEGNEPIGYEECNWAAEPYSGGCYTSTYPPGVMTRFGRDIRKPVGHMHFAGTETATHWTGYMDGAVQAGERAAWEVFTAMNNPAVNDINLDEPEFEDAPAVPFQRTVLEEYAPSIGSLLILCAVSSTMTAATVVALRNSDLVLSAIKGLSTTV